MNPTTDNTVALVKEALFGPQNAIAKSITQATGLVAYDLQAPALSLFPVITPLRNRIPRVKANGGTATNWRSITGINTGHTSAGVSEGNRGAIVTTGTQNNVAMYKGLGLEDNVTFEADYAAETFEDVKALAVRNLLSAVMIAEEKKIIGGNSGSLCQLGTTPTPALVASGSGSSLTGTAYTVQCIALTHAGYLNSSVVPTASNPSGGVQAVVTKTNADGSTDTFGGGSAQISAATTITPAAGNNITATAAAVKGAVAYGWYWGTGGTAYLGSITTTNQVVISAAATGTQTAASMPGADNSGDALSFDGLISQICATTSTSGSYYAALNAGATLTSNGAAGVVEINTALSSFWNNYNLSPDLMLVNSQELQNLTTKVLGSGGASLFRFNQNGAGGTIRGNEVIGSYLNPFTMSGGAEIEIALHPNVPPGTILFMSRSIPYPLSNVPNVLQMKVRQEYYQLEWTKRSRRYEYGVYCDEVLQNYFPPAFGMITNITNG